MKPILYSFRRCPYAMRARLAILAAEQVCELREVVLKKKPQAMLDVSPKGTVPVLLSDNIVIDESIDIMRWAVTQNSPADWSLAELDDPLIVSNDGEFKHYLDRYKYFDRYPEHDQSYYFNKAVVFLETLEQNLVTNRSVATNGVEHFLITPYASALDSAIYPFVRQFAFVDKLRFDQLPLPKLHTWLNIFLSSTQFQTSMQNFDAWSPDQETPILFGV